MSARFKELQGVETSLRAKMDLTRGKAIALFRSLLEETAFPDLSVAQLLEQGAHLVGDEPHCPLFSKRPNPNEQELEALAPFRRKLLVESRQGRGPEDVATLLRESAAEVEAGYLKGPFHSQEEVSAEVGTDSWSLAPRFALRQGEDAKVRVIDDFKMSSGEPGLRVHLVSRATGH